MRCTCGGDADCSALPPPAPGARWLPQAAVAKRTLFYTEGSEELLVARRAAAAWSLASANRRAARLRALEADEAAAEGWAEAQRRALARAAKAELACSELGDERPLSACAFSGGGGGGGDVLVTAAWSGAVKVWDRQGDELKRSAAWLASAERVTGVALHPEACAGGGGSDAARLMTASADGTATLWSMSGQSRATLKGHLARLARCAWHPSGALVATASYDKTWRLWDVETGAELLLQEGHSRGVYCVAFQPDGALCATGGMDELVRVWDVRTGRCVHVTKGHARPVLACDFSPDGFSLASGSEDNTVRTWDLRRRMCTATLPAHVNLISALKYSPEADGAVLATASFDGTAALWSSRDGRLVRRLQAHEGKVTDIAVDAQGRVATVAHDRTVKLWSPPPTDEDDDAPMEE